MRLKLCIPKIRNSVLVDSAPLSHSGSILRNGAFVFLATVAIGTPSVFVLYVANIVLLPNELSNFVKIWALINTLIVGVTSPLLTFAPNLRLDFGRSFKEFDDSFFAVSTFMCSIFVIPTQLAAYFWVFDLEDSGTLVPLTLFSVFSISFSIKNALLIAKASYSKYFSSAALFGLTTSLGLLFVNVTRVGSVSLLFYVFGFALAVASVDKFVLSLVFFSHQKLQRFIFLIYKLKSFYSLLVTIFITSTSVFIINGPLIIGSYIGANDAELITFGTFLNIGFILYTILNSFTAPIQTRLISCLNSADFDQFQLVYRKAFKSYLLVAISTTLFLTITINFLAQFYISSVITKDIFSRLVLSASFGFSTLTVLPRVGLMILHRYLSLFLFWIAGLILFLFVIFLPINAFIAMVLAPASASGLILLACHLTFKHHIKFKSFLI